MHRSRGKWIHKAQDRIYLTRAEAARTLLTSHRPGVIMRKGAEEEFSRWRTKGMFRIVRRGVPIHTTNNWHWFPEQDAGAVEDFLDALETHKNKRGIVDPLAIYRMRDEDPDYLHIGRAASDPKYKVVALHPPLPFKTTGTVGPVEPIRRSRRSLIESPPNELTA